MQASLLPILRCPLSGSLLTLAPNGGQSGEEIRDGILLSTAGPCFPILEGVPKMLPDAMFEHEDFLKSHLPDFSERKAQSISQFGEIIAEAEKKNCKTRASFSEEWASHDYEQGKTWELDIHAQLQRFLTETDESISSLQGKLLLDAGCGNGHLAMELAKNQIEIVAMDFSKSIIRATKINKNPLCHFIQGDVEFPPFEKGIFDLIQSSGVLIHTRNTKNSFGRLAAFVKPGGRISIWVYRKRKEIIHQLFNQIRNITSSMPGWLQGPFLRIFIFLPALIAKKIRGNTQKSSELWVEVLDWFTPEFRWEHSVEEVMDWFDEQGFHNKKLSDQNHWGFNITGIKTRPKVETPT